MKSTIIIFGEELEYDFISAWIKYTRIKNELSQEALAHGICSVSHLSYFENGKKHLRKEIIEALLRKLNIVKIDKLANMGLLRQKLNTMMNDIEGFNFDGAKTIYNSLLEIEDIINLSPYNIEFKIYELMYKVFAENMEYHELKNDIHLLDKIYKSLNDELKYLYLLTSGSALCKHSNSQESVERLTEALNIKDTSWANYSLGKTYCFTDSPASAAYYLEKALDSYEKSGRYLNAVWCHNYLGICFSYLKIYKNAEKHFNAAFMSAKHFDMDKLYYHLYIDLSNLYTCKGEYEESIKWSSLAMKTDADSLLAAYNYIDACIKLNRIDFCEEVFQKYLDKQYENSLFYKAVYFLYLVAYSYNDDCFYEEVKNKILPYYEALNRIDVCKDIKLKLIQYLENRRRYKEANKIYKELLS